MKSRKGLTILLTGVMVPVSYTHLGNSCMGKSKFDIKAGISASVSHLVVGASGAEDGKCADKGDVSHGSKACSHVNHVGLRNAGIKKPFRKFICKMIGHGGVGEICVQSHDPFIRFS